MFWENFVSLCKDHHTSPGAVTRSLSLSNSTATRWKKGSVPSGETIKRIADYFGVPVTALLSDSAQVFPNVSNPVQLTPDELLLVSAYRSHPELHDVIRKLLDIPCVAAGSNTQDA